MENKYFDRWEFEQAITSLLTNPFIAKTKFEQYLSKYPKDYSAYPYYASCLITLKQLEKAERVLNYVTIISRKDSRFSNNPSKVSFLKHNILHNRLRLLSYQEKYRELFELCSENIQEIRNMDMNPVIFYAKKKAGKLDLSKREENSYLFRQIVEYRESDFLENVRTRFANYNGKINNPYKSFFTLDFPFFEVLEEVKKHMPSNKSIYPNAYDEAYLFKYNECGKIDNRFTDYFKVICFHNTKDIVTMYPVNRCYGLPYTDLNYLNSNLVIDDTKIKKLSRIERFNRRYEKK